MNDEYPVSTDQLFDYRTYQVQRAAVVQRLTDILMNKDTLYRMQLAVFDAKMELLKFILAEGMVPTSDDEIEIEIRVGRRAIDSEATDGKWITLPVTTHHFMTAKLKTDALTRALLA